MAETEPHPFLTPKAVQGLAFGAFALGGVGLMLAGGSLVYGGFVVACVFCGLITYLHAGEIAASVRDKGARKHLILPGLAVVIVMAAGIVIFKRKVLDALTLQQFIAVAWRPLVSGAVYLFEDPESWFLLVALSGFWLWQQRRQPAGTKTGPALRERLEAASVQRANDDRARLFQTWDRIDPLSLCQACCLWNEERPPTSHEWLKGDAHTCYIALVQGIQAGTLIPLLTRQGQAVQVNPALTLSRADLRDYFEQTGTERPPFLYPDQR